MKKLLSILLITSFLLSAFAGCSEEKPQQPDDTTVTSEIEETTVDTTDAVEETTAETTDVFIDYEERDDLYKATASSGISTPEMRADYFYLESDTKNNLYRYFYQDVENIPWHRDVFISETLNQKVNDFIRNATEELSKISVEEVQSYLDSNNYRAFLTRDYKYDGQLFLEKKLINGYFSVLVAIPYFEGDNITVYYYDVRTVVFDIYTEEEVEFSDMFFDDVDFVPILNNYIAKKSHGYKMKRDFSGLVTDNFAFTVDSVIIIKDSDFVHNGVTIPISQYMGANIPWLESDSLMEYMVTSVPRDMTGYLKEDLERYRDIVCIKGGIYERKDICDVWYLENEIPFATDKACSKVNAFIDDLCENYFTQEKLNEMANAEVEVKENGRPTFYTYVVGERYILLTGNNGIWAAKQGTYNSYSFLDDFDSMFYYYFDVKTGELINPDWPTLFKDGWHEAAGFYYEDGFCYYYPDTWVEYNKDFDINKCTIIQMTNYESSAYASSPVSCDVEFVYIDVKTENGDRVMIIMPRGYIK